MEAKRDHAQGRRRSGRSEGRQGRQAGKDRSLCIRHPPCTSLRHAMAARETLARKKLVARTRFGGARSGQVCCSRFLKMTPDANGEKQCKQRRRERRDEDG